MTVEPRGIAIALPWASASVLALFVGLAFFAFPASDDFCFAAKANELGFVAAQDFWYHAWSGRFASNAALSAAASGRSLVEHYPIWAIGVLLATLLAIFMVVWSVGRAHAPLHVLAAVALVVNVILLSLVPDPAQTFYWMTGSLTYQLGNIAFLLLVALLVEVERASPLGYGKAFVITVVAGLVTVVAVGANEVSLVLTVACLAAGAAAGWIWMRPSRYVWCGLAAMATAAAAIAVLSPGSAVRAGSLAGDGMLRPPALLAAVAYLPWAVLRTLYWSSNLAVWASAVLLAIVSWHHVHPLVYRSGTFDRRLYAIPIAWIALMLILHVIGFAINRYPLPERAESVIATVFLLGWYPTFVVMAHRILGKPCLSPGMKAKSAVMVLLLIGILGSPTVFEAYKDVYRGFRYSKEMQERHEVLRAHRGNRTADLRLASVSRPPRTIFATDIVTDRDNSRNSCIADYYELKSVTLGPPR